MEYTIEGSGDSRTIRAKGTLKYGDHPITQSISELLDLKAVNEITLDVSELQGIDSFGLGVLIKINKHAIENGKSFIISGAQGRVKETFDLFKLDRELTFA